MEFVVSPHVIGTQRVRTLSDRCGSISRPSPIPGLPDEVLAMLLLKQVMVLTVTEIPDPGTNRIVPSFARFRAIAENYYILCDPSALLPGEYVTFDGRVDNDRLARFLFTKSLGIGLLFGLLALLVIEPSIIALALAFIIGAPVGFIAVLLRIRLAIDSAIRRVEGRILRIDQQALEAWGFCKMMEQLAATSAWSTGVVDRDRLVPGLLWRSVKTCTELAKLDLDIEQATAHPALTHLVEQKVRQQEEARASLDGIRQRLGMVLASARQLDARERARYDENVRSREESELWEKLSGAVPPSHQQLDDELLAATVQTEADVLNKLLAESDRISSDLRLYE